MKNKKVIRSILNQTELVVRQQLRRAESFSPSLAARAWGIWQNPFGELRQWKISRMTADTAEARFHSQSALDFLNLGEWLVRALWKKQNHLSRVQFAHLLGVSFEPIKQDTLFLNESLFVARFQDASGQSLKEGQDVQTQVQFFDTKEHLVARAQYDFVIKRSEQSGIYKRLLGM